jgi:hypothetical protein
VCVMRTSSVAKCFSFTSALVAERNTVSVPEGSPSARIVVSRMLVGPKASSWFLSPPSPGNGTCVGMAMLVVLPGERPGLYERALASAATAIWESCTRATTPCNGSSEPSWSEIYCRHELFSRQCRYSSPLESGFRDRFLFEQPLGLDMPKQRVAGYRRQLKLSPSL